MVSCLLIFFLNTSCEKAGQIHLISAQTWVVKDLSSISSFPRVGDELTFLDNRLFFNNSNGVETDGKWDFQVSGGGFGPTPSYQVESLYIATDLGSYDFSVIKLTNTELEIKNISSSNSFTVRLEAKE
jgi:hypothetical protein